MRLLAVASTLLFVASAHSQSFSTGACEHPQDRWSGGMWSRSSHVCESRKTVLPLRDGRVAVQGENGGIEVVGEDRRDVALEAEVSAQAHSEQEARELLKDVRVLTDGTIRAEGPRYLEGKSWNVSYKLHVPHKVAAQLDTKNGGIRLAELEGMLHAQTTNGGLTLTHVAGDVQATTVNGSLRIELEGDGWHGNGLNARSTNGGVHISVPQNYSAHLVAGTVNGGTHVSVPTSGSESNGSGWRSRNHIDTNLGHGGATLRVETTNGGITVD